MEMNTTVTKSGGRPQHQYWEELQFKMVNFIRPDGNKRNGAYCLLCSKTLKNTAVGRLRAHRKACGNSDLKLLKPKTEAETETTVLINEGEEEPQEQQQTWEIHQTSVSENEERTYQIVETVSDESFRQENQGDIIHAIQTVVPASTATNIVQQTVSHENLQKQPIVQNIQKKKQKFITMKTPVSSRNEEFTYIEETPQPTVQTSGMSLSKKQKIDQALSIFIIGCNLPFDIVDSDDFRNFVQALNPNYRIPTSKSLKSDVLDKLRNPQPSTSTTQYFDENGRNISYEDSDSEPEVKRIKL